MYQVNAAGWIWFAAVDCRLAQKYYPCEEIAAFEE
jgi:hypothetical protein